MESRKCSMKLWPRLRAHLLNLFRVPYICSGYKWGYDKRLTSYRPVSSLPSYSNCDTSTSTILLKAGVSPKEIKKLQKMLPGLTTGFDSTPRAWTKEEQEKAVSEE